MVDIGDQVRGVLDSVEAVTLDEVVAAARRRRSRRRLSVGVGAGTVAVAVALIAVWVLVTGRQTAQVVVGPGGTTPLGTPQSLGQAVPPASFINDQLKHRVSIDGGQLKLDPPPTGQHPALSAQQARVILAEASYGWVSVPEDFGLAEVTIPHSLSSDASRYDHRLAWVALFAQSTEINCKYVPGSPSGSQPQFFEAVILDADTGSAVINYQSRGFSFCGGPIFGPTVQAATEMLSLAWTAIGTKPTNSNQVLPPDRVPAGGASYSWVLRYTKPPCATDLTTGLSAYRTLTVTVIVPIDTPDSCSPPVTVTAIFGPETTPLSEIIHGPTGPVAIRNGGYTHV